MRAMTTTIIGVGNLGGTVARHLVSGETSSWPRRTSRGRTRRRRRPPNGSFAQPASSRWVSEASPRWDGWRVPAASSKVGCSTSTEHMPHSRRRSRHEHARGLCPDSPVGSRPRAQRAAERS